MSNDECRIKEFYHFSFLRKWREALPYFDTCPPLEDSKFLVRYSMLDSMAQSVQIGNSEILKFQSILTLCSLPYVLCAFIPQSEFPNPKSKNPQHETRIPQRAISTNQLPLYVRPLYLSEAVRQTGRISLYGYKASRHSRDQQAQVLDSKKLGAVKGCATNNFFNWKSGFRHYNHLINDGDSVIHSGAAGIGAQRNRYSQLPGGSKLLYLVIQVFASDIGIFSNLIQITAISPHGNRCGNPKNSFIRH